MACRPAQETGASELNCQFAKPYLLAALIAKRIVGNCDGLFRGDDCAMLVYGWFFGGANA